MIQQWAIGVPRRQQPAAGAAISQATATRRRFIPRTVTAALALSMLALTACAMVLPVTAATSSYYLHPPAYMNHVPAGTGSKTTVNLVRGNTLTWTSTDAYPSGYVVPAGAYTFTATWQKDASAFASITFTVGYAAGGCATFTPLVSWTSDVNAPPQPTTTGATTAHATDLPSGGPFRICFRIHVNSITCRGVRCPLALIYDTKRFQAILNLPPIEVAERVLPLAGLVLFVPLAAGLVARRRVVKA
jgi:hypothetical protein